MPSSWPSTGRRIAAVCLDRFADLLFPPRCLICRKVLPFRHGPRQICEACLTLFDFVSAPFCPRCGLPYDDPGQDNHTCGECYRQRRYFGSARSVFRYQGFLPKLLVDFKFRERTELARFFGHHIRESFPLGGVEYDLVVPVPLHPRRLRWRGFNQSLLLARQVAAPLGIPLGTRLLLRVRDTRPQLGLSGRQRAHNVRGAFRAVPSPIWRGARVLLVDDVFTTGSTVRECSKVIRRAGVARVDVLTVARAA